MPGFDDKVIEPESKRNGANDSEVNRPIGTARVLSTRQFYYVYCLLSDIRDCVAHSLSFPMAFHDETSKENDRAAKYAEEMECQICMDQRKDVVLPCSHSFCLPCFRSWSTQSQTCPMCRSIIKCSEGEELWQLTFNEANDIQSYANDLVARIFEFFDKMPESSFTEDDITRSNYDFSAAAIALKQRLVLNLGNITTVTGAAVLATPPSSSSSSLEQVEGIIDSTTVNTITTNGMDPDYLLALSLACDDDQFEAERQIRALYCDEIVAQALTTEIHDRES